MKCSFIKEVVLTICQIQGQTWLPTREAMVGFAIQTSYWKENKHIGNELNLVGFAIQTSCGKKKSDISSELSLENGRGTKIKDLKYEEAEE